MRMNYNHRHCIPVSPVEYLTSVAAAPIVITILIASLAGVWS